MFKMCLMTDEYAEIINTWKYDAPYEEYSFANNESDFEQITSGYYFVIVDENDELSGFFAIGPAAQNVEDNEEIFDDESYTDIALGLKPELTGKGMGKAFCEACFSESKTLFPEDRGVRLCVMNNNMRALNLYEKLGFKCIFQNDNYKIMIKDTN